MKHLTVDEIIGFVSLNELNTEALQFSAAVNGHIRKCEKCLKLVRAFQMIYDEFSQLNANVDFKGFALERVSEETVKTEDISESHPALDEIDDYK